MAANFTATSNLGGTVDDVVLTNGGTSTPAVTVIVNTTKCTTPSQVAELLDRLKARILQEDWPAA